MRGLTVIFRRELSGLFLTPLAWVLLLAAVGLNGFLLVAMLRTNGGDVDGTDDEDEANTDDRHGQPTSWRCCQEDKR